MKKIKSHLVRYEDPVSNGVFVHHIYVVYKKKRKYRMPVPNLTKLMKRFKWF
jgi:hypothetical protein